MLLMLRSQQLRHPTICKGGAAVVIDRGKGRLKEA